MVNPLSLGQIVNNCNVKEGFLPNVMYREITLNVDGDDPPGSRRVLSLLPNINYEQLPYLKIVVLVATRKIHAGEELLATYFTLID